MVNQNSAAHEPPARSSFLGLIIGPFAPKPTMIATGTSFGQANAFPTRAAPDKEEEKELPHDMTEPESDSDSSRSLEHPSSPASTIQNKEDEQKRTEDGGDEAQNTEQDNAGSPVKAENVESPVQADKVESPVKADNVESPVKEHKEESPFKKKRGGFLSMFFKSDDSEMKDDANAEGPIFESVEEAVFDQDEGEEASQEQGQSPAKEPSLLDSLFNKKTEDANPSGEVAEANDKETEVVEPDDKETASAEDDKATKEATDTFMTNEATESAPSSKKEHGMFGFFFPRKEETKAPVHDAADETQGGNTLVNDDDLVDTLEETVEESTNDEAPRGVVEEAQTQATKARIVEPRGKMPEDETMEDDSGKEQDLPTTNEIDRDSKETEPGFFGKLFGRKNNRKAQTKEAQPEAEAPSVETEEPDKPAKGENEVDAEKENEMDAVDKNEEETSQMHASTDDVSIADSVDDAAVDSRAEQELKEDDKTSDVESKMATNGKRQESEENEAVPEDVVKSLVEEPEQSTETSEVLFSGEETGLEMELESALGAPLPLQDPYWDDNEKGTKEKMCCSFLLP